LHNGFSRGCVPTAGTGRAGSDRSRSWSGPAAAHAFAVADPIDRRDPCPLPVDLVNEAQDTIKIQFGQTSRIAFLP
jgi:hypothetical protein